MYTDIRTLFLDRSDLVLLQLMLFKYSPPGATPPIYRSVMQKVSDAAWLSCTCEMTRIPLSDEELALLRQCNTDFCAILSGMIARSTCSGSAHCIAITTYQDATRLQHLFSKI